MAVTWLDPGGSATGGTQFLDVITGTGHSAQTGTTNGQAYAYQLTTGSPAATVAVGRTANSGIAAAGNRVSVFFRVPSLPGSNTVCQPLGIFPTASNVNILGIYLGSDGKLRLYTNTTTTLLKTGTTVLSSGTWYRLTLSYTITSTSNWGCKVYIDGALEMTATNSDGTLSSASPTAVKKMLNSGAGANFLLFWSDLYIDTTTNQTDPGNIHVTAKLPTTNTTNGFDTTLGTGAVNERPVGTTNGKQHANTTDVDQDYDIQTAAVGDKDISAYQLVESMGWIWAAVSSLTGSPASKIIVNGARSSTGWDPASASTATLFTVIIGSGSSYPRHASNGKNIGSSSTTIAADTFLYDCGVVIAYIPIVSQTLSGEATPAGGIKFQVNKVLTRGLAYDAPAPYDSNLPYDQSTPILFLAGAPTVTKIPAGGGTQTVNISGTLTASGVVIKQVNKPLAGTLTSAGALVRQTNKKLAGSLTSSGTLTGQLTKLLAGSLTSSGILRRQINKSFVGSVTSSGSLVVIKAFTRTFTGSLAPSGTLLRVVTKTLSGALTPAGALVTQKITAGSIILSGTLAPSGELIKKANKLFAGPLTSSGVLVRSKYFPRSFAGTLTSAGAIKLTRQKVFTGTLTTAGAALKVTVSKSLSAALAPVGTVVKLVSKKLTRGVPYDSLAPYDSSLPYDAQGPVLFLSGVLTRDRSSIVGAFFTGTMGTVGALSKVVVKKLGGVLNLSGTISDKVNRVVATFSSIVAIANLDHFNVGVTRLTGRIGVATTATTKMVSVVKQAAKRVLIVPKVER